MCVCENEATIYSHHGSAVTLRNILIVATHHNDGLVDLPQWFPMYRWKFKQGRLRVKKWALLGRSKPEFCIFNVTTLVCSVGSLREKGVEC